MKLDPTDIRYISDDAYRVLSAVEQGSKNHELVPIGLIAQISGARSGGVNKALGELAKRKLVGRVQNAKYEGYRLTYGGYDFLAARTFGKRDTVYSIGNQIGTGKESDIYVVADKDGDQFVMKIHRLGRVSFRAIKSKRDYLRKGQSASWMYMSRLAAIKEFAFMKVLYDHGFPVPKPIDQSRHCLIMELIDAFPLRQLSSVPSPGSLYSSLMSLLVRLAHSGLIHGDFNEFNILIRDHRSPREKERDEESEEMKRERIEKEGGDFELVEEEEEWTEERRKKGKLEVVVIDFPQMVSTDHRDAEYYFNRDVTCIRSFFLRRFKYESSLYPKFSAVIKDGVREFDLDVEVEASGFTKVDRRRLDEYMEEVGKNGTEGQDDDEEEGLEEEEEEGEEVSEPSHSEPEEGGSADEVEEEEEGPVASTSTSTSMAKAIPEVRLEGLSLDDKEEEESGEESEEEEEEKEEEVEHRTHRPSARRVKVTKVDVESIVTSQLSRTKASTERRHHGKRQQTANMVGRRKGSKAKQAGDGRRAVKEAEGW